jgi:hypothetical protein
MTRLNLGCGYNKKEGFINVDRAQECAPDVVFDLEQPDWPWETDSASEVLFNHSLEHVGQNPQVFLRIMQELYRVCAPNAVVRINVPHPRHDNFIDDPTHVRVITPGLLTLFDRKLNVQWIKDGASNSPLAMYTRVDFTTQSVAAIPTPTYGDMLKQGKITHDGLMTLARESNNVIQEYKLVLVAQKPFAGA